MIKSKGEIQQMYCKYCGQQIDDNAQFCPYCGKQLGAANDDHIKQRNNKQKKEKKAPRRVWCWLVCLALFMIATIALLFTLKNRDGNNTQVSVRADDSLYTPDDKAVETDEETGISFVNNIIIIFFQPDTDQELIDSTIASIEGEVVGKLDFINQYQVRISRHSLEELRGICEDLEEQDHVISAIYDEALVLETDTIPDDPWAGHWWSPQVWSQEEPDGANWWLEAIDAPDAWDYNSYFSKIKIGVIDNGFDVGHEDLKNIISSVSAGNDNQKHGTHVAGIIGAEANNKKGITGIVWNCELLTKDCKLNQKQEKDGQYKNWDTMNRILGYTSLLIHDGAKVVNLSLGLEMPSNTTAFSQKRLDEHGRRASAYLYALRQQGYDFVIVQAAGNGNEAGVSVDSINNGLFCSINKNNCVCSETITANSIIDRIIVVGAAQNGQNNNYTQCSFSNAGSRVDICAPGENVYSTVPGGWSGEYDYDTGTSMAAPIVTGVAALVWSANPKLTGYEVKGIVCSKEYTKYDVGDNTTSDHPLVNSYRMVNASLAVKAAIALLDRPTDEVWKIINEDNSENDDLNEAVHVSLDSMYDAMFSFMIAREFVDRNGEDLQNNPEAFWKMVALYATRKAYSKAPDGKEKLAEEYRDDEGVLRLTIKEDEVRDFINAVMPEIKSYPPLPTSDDEKYLYDNGKYYLPIIDVFRDSCRIKSSVTKNNGNVEAVIEIFSTQFDFVSVSYKLEMVKNKKINTKSSEPYQYCIKNAVIIDEPSKEYLQLIKEYESAIKEYALLEQDPNAFAAKYPLINANAIRQMNAYDDSTLCSAYEDINGDGEYELVLEIYTGNWQNNWSNIIAVYSRSNKKVIPLLKDLGELSTTTFYNDGTIWVHEQGLYGKETFYKILEGGKEIEVVAQYETDWENHSDFPYSDGSNRFSTEQFEEKHIRHKEEMDLRFTSQ